MIFYYVTTSSSAFSYNYNHVQLVIYDQHYLFGQYLINSVQFYIFGYSETAEQQFQLSLGGTVYGYKYGNGFGFWTWVFIVGFII